MKLELKHLAAYLPFAINVVIYSENEPKIDYISGIYHNPDEMVVFSEEEDYYLSNPDYNVISFKLMLRPMSDLPKFIDVISPVPNFFNTEILMKTPLASSYEVFEKLVELHFDVFGLIDAGLAVDINSL